MESGIGHNCGVFGIWGDPQAAQLAHLGIFSLQHRGENGCGIAVSDGEDIAVRRAPGLVMNALDPTIDGFPSGIHAIAHTRYATTGDVNPYNLQPILKDSHRGQIAVAHNGNLTNADELRRMLLAEGATFEGTTDTEVIPTLLARSQKVSLTQALQEALSLLEGSFSLVIMMRNTLIGACDIHGNRPLVLGKYKNGWVLASESCALQLIGATVVRELEAGEMVIISNDSVPAFVPSTNREPRPARCIFERLYFARPDSVMWGNSNDTFRQICGEILANEQPVLGDLVIPVPDSGVPAAIAFARTLNIPFGHGLVRNHYVGRSFTLETQDQREWAVRLKLSAVPDLVSGKRVIVVDDSIVRGTTIGPIIRILREAGAKEVHVRISSSPVKHPCFFGIAMSEKKGFIAQNMSLEQIRQHIGATSLGFVSTSGLKAACGDSYEQYCMACFTGEYLIKTPASFTPEATVAV